MPKKRLTEEGVRKLQPQASQQVDYFDVACPGLVLRVSYGGTKTWRVLFYINRKTRIHGLGRYPILNVAQAREKARKFLQDPAKALAQGEPDSFQQVAENFLKRHVDGNPNSDPPTPPLRSKPEIVRCLHKYIYPRWKDRKFVELRRNDVAGLLDRIEDNNGPWQADMVLAILSKLMRWYQARHDEYVSPVVPGMRRSKPAERKRKRILEDSEIRSLWEAANGTFGAILKLALLSAQRREKIATMKWEDLVDGEWRIASEAREKASAGSLRLPPMALAILEGLPRIAGNPYVFASGERKHFNSWSQRKHELDELLGIPAWVIHDCRRTARSLMSRAGVRPDIAERTLGHAIIGVEGVYDRHQWRDEKADALQRLADLIERILHPPTADNVVELACSRS
jgi:integrase